MNYLILNDPEEMGREAARLGAGIIRDAIDQNGSANIILATGSSQFQVLASLVKEDVEWSRVNCFHLDEYLGISSSHPASFRYYLEQRFASRVEVGSFHMIDGEQEPYAECERLAKVIKRHPIDVAFVGIGENGHLAFNDPPADFNTVEPYIVVELDDACRQQQTDEGWFTDVQSVPRQAISMSIQQIMRSKYIVCSVPDQRKANAVKATIEGPITPQVPASILHRHSATTIFLDVNSAQLLNST